VELDASDVPSRRMKALPQRKHYPARHLRTYLCQLRRFASCFV